MLFMRSWLLTYQIKAPTTGELKGILIDLDLAKELDNLTSEASHQIGIMQFIAIKVL
jgi:hypothetical protein